MVAIKSLGDHHYHDHHSSSSPGRASVLCLVNLLSVLGIALFSYAIGFGMSMLFLRYLSMEQYGDIMVAKQILLVVSVVLSMGTKNVSKRFLINYLHEKSSRYKDFIWWHFSYLLRLVLIFSVLYSCSVLLFLCLDSYDYLKLEHFHVAYWSLVSAPFWALASILCIYLLSFGYVIMYDFFVSILQNLLWIVMVMFWMFLFPVPDSWYLVLFLVVQSLLFFSIIALSVFIFLKKPLSATLKLSDALYVDKRWQSHRLSSLLIDLYSSLPVMIFLTTVEVFHSGDHLVGHLSLALSISIIFYLIPQSVYPLVYSHLDHLVRLPKEGADDVVLLKQANRVVLALNLMVFCVIAVFGYDILALFGERSVHAYHMLLLLSGASFIGGLYYPMLNFALISQGESRFIGLMDLFVYIALFVLGPLVVIYFGGYYAAYLYAFLIFFQFLVSNIWFVRQSGFMVFKLF